MALPYCAPEYRGCKVPFIMQKADIIMFCKNTNLRSLPVSLSLKTKAGKPSLVSFFLFTLLLCIGNGYTYAQTDTAVLDYKNDTTHLFTLTKSGKVGIGTGTPTAQLHTLGTVRFAKYRNNTYEDSVLTTDENGNLKFAPKSKFDWSGTFTDPHSVSFNSTYASSKGNISWWGEMFHIENVDTASDAASNIFLENSRLRVETMKNKNGVVLEGMANSERCLLYIKPR
jgi:hypothetical protein